MLSCVNNILRTGITRIVDVVVLQGIVSITLTRLRSSVGVSSGKGVGSFCILGDKEAAERTGPSLSPNEATSPGAGAIELSYAETCSVFLVM